MRKIPRVPKLDNPVMIDRAFACLQDSLAKNIGWLDYAFGRAQRLVTLRDRVNYYYPGVHISKNEYVNVLPGEELGNRTFFFVEDPQAISYNPRMYNLITAPFSLVCWYDLRKIFPNGAERNTEEIKRQLLRVLTDTTMPRGTRIELAKIYEQAENIFKGYSLREIDTQYLMQPYAGIRIDGFLMYREECV